VEALDQVLDETGPDRAAYLVERLSERARTGGAELPIHLNTPYVNTIRPDEEVSYPGDRAMERRIKSLIRWNAMAMVVRQNKYDAGIGGHISTYASLATLLEVGFNHFFRASYGDQPGDLIYFQGHASPGVYARAFLEGRLSEDHLKNFRHELRDKPGLSSYPHPWLMPDFCGSHRVHGTRADQLHLPGALHAVPGKPRRDPAHRAQGVGVSGRWRDRRAGIHGIAHAGLAREAGQSHLRRELQPAAPGWPGARQRQDHPGTGSGFPWAGWNVIKLIWGEDWDALLERDTTGLLVKRMGEAVDGEFQTYVTRDGAYIRKNFFGKYPELLDLVSHLSDEELFKLHRGGHDPCKVYNAFKDAVEFTAGPRWCWPTPSKATDWAKPARAATSLTSRRSSTKPSSSTSNRALKFLSRRSRAHGVLLPAARGQSEIAYMHERRRLLGATCRAAPFRRGRLRRHRSIT